MRFAWADDVMLADGRAVATFAQERFRDRATVEVDGETWLFRKDGFGGAWAASHDGVDRIRARSTSAWRMRCEVDAPSGTYEVRRSGLFPSASFELLAGGVVVGDIHSTAFWQYVPELRAPDAMPAAEAAFVLWLVRSALGRASAAVA